MVNNVMEWQQKQHRWQANDMRCVVMTDEQLETLRKQIAVYATICEQLVQMHKTISDHQDLADYCQAEVVYEYMTVQLVPSILKRGLSTILAFNILLAYQTVKNELSHRGKHNRLAHARSHHKSGTLSVTSFRLGNMYCDPLLGSGGPKIALRQRWTPTAMQLQILERIFEQGTGTPSKDKIKEISAELNQHGHISETNVYNWFQNRRARSKRKQHNVATSVNAESEVEAEVDSKDKKTKLEDEFQSLPSDSAGSADNLGFQNADNLQYLNPETSKPDSEFPSDDSLRSTRNFDHVPVFDGLLSNSSM